MNDEQMDGNLLGLAVTHKLLQEVSDLHREENETFLEYFIRLNNVAELSNSMITGFELIRATSLAQIEDVWEQIPIEERKPYNYQFRIYAERVCRSLQYSTIQNHIRAARTFVLNGIGPKDKVEIIVRDENDKPVMEAGRPKTELVEFNPLNVGISKLVLVNSAAKKGQMDANPKLWSLVADSVIRVEDVRVELFSRDSKIAGIDMELRFELAAGFLIAHQNGEEYPIIDGEGFKWDEYYDTLHPHHDLVKISINRILSALNVKPDEEIIRGMLRRSNEYEKIRQSRRIS